MSKRPPADARDPDYLRFLETYSWERYIEDGKIGPLPAWRASRA